MTNNMTKNTLFTLANLSVTPKSSKTSVSDRQLKKDIDDMAGVFIDPLVIHRSGWADRSIVPDWLRKRIIIDRLIEVGLAHKEGRQPTGTDSEALAYMIPASLEAPLDSDWSEIYLHLGTVVMNGRDGKEMPDDIKVKELDQYRRGLLNGLKRWIYEQRLKHRKQDRQTETKEAESETKPAKPETPAVVQYDLFQF